MHVCYAPCLLDNLPSRQGPELKGPVTTKTWGLYLEGWRAASLALLTALHAVMSTGSPAARLGIPSMSTAALQPAVGSRAPIATCSCS